MAQAWLDAAGAERRWGTTRDPQKAEVLRAHSVEVFALEDGAALAAAWGAASHALISTPPGPEGDPAFLALGDLIRTPGPAWVGYLSTTGVYGDRAGGWVFEDDAPAPMSERGRRRLAPEQAWISTGLNVQIFRLPGIYGPGRGPAEKLKAGKAQNIIKPGQVFSRAHREDIVSALLASMARPNPGAVYNVCDDAPAPPQDVTNYAADLLGLPHPPDVAFERAELSPMAREFYAESKRVSNARLKAELGWRPRFPSYREGLAADLVAR
ncbi:MAG: SDR family oxidoreductase [Maricaulaceae bacterium]